MLFHFTYYVLMCFSFCRLQPAKRTPPKSSRTKNSNTQRTEKNTTGVVIHQHRRKLVKIDILMSETCWAHNKWNKIAGDIKLVFRLSTMRNGNYCYWCLHSMTSRGLICERDIFDCTTIPVAKETQLFILFTKSYFPVILGSITDHRFAWCLDGQNKFGWINYKVNKMYTGAWRGC